MASSLNNDERYVIAYFRSDRAAAARWGWLVARLLTAVVFLYGFAKDDPAMLFNGFGTLLILDIYIALKQPRYTRSLCSAVTKLESRIEELESPGAIATPPDDPS